LPTPAFAFTSDEQLIDAVSRYLGAYTVSLRHQLPTCERHSVDIEIDANDLGENTERRPFTASCLFEGTLIVGSGQEPAEAIDTCVSKARDRGAYVKHETKFVDGLRRMMDDVAHREIEEFQRPDRFEML
jgi:hypothetical protein